MKFMTSDGAFLHYRREGQGEPLLFIHGLASNLHSWNYQIRHFRQHYDTLAYDCRGHGQSTLPPTLHLDDHVRDAKELCALFDRPVTVIGISMGGFIAQRLLIELPQCVKRAVLIATKSHNEGMKSSPLNDLGRQDTGDPKELRYAFARKFLFGPDTSEERVRAFVQAEEPMPEEQFRLLRDATGPFDHRPFLAACHQPVLVVHGDHDRLIPPEYGRELAHLLPHATLQWIPGGGHALILEKHEQVNAAIERWLQQTPLA